MYKFPEKGKTEICPQKKQRDLDFAKLDAYKLEGMGGR